LFIWICREGLDATFRLLAQPVAVVTVGGVLATMAKGFMKPSLVTGWRWGAGGRGGLSVLFLNTVTPSLKLLKSHVFFTILLPVVRSVPSV